MHVVFGLAALIMLVGTVWMLAKDHLREWRATELANRNKERWTAEAQLAQETALSESELEKFGNELDAIERSHVEPTILDAFKKRITEEDERLATEGVKEDPANFEELDADATILAQSEPGSEEAKEARSELVDRMTEFVSEAKRREDALTTKRKFTAAEQTATVSMRGIAIGEGKPKEEVAEIEEKITGLAEQIAELDIAVAHAKSYRLALEGIVKQVTRREDELKKEIAAIDANLGRLHENLLANSGGVGEWVNRWPVLDALYNGNIKLEQIWLPDITINYNFSSVARYDRCINCHRAIDQTAPGSATEPAYPDVAPEDRVRVISLNTPDAAPATEAAEGQPAPPQPTLQDVYGFTIAPHGQINSYAVTIQVVLPESLAAKAGLQTGDIIEKVNGGNVYTAGEVEGYLMVNATWGEPIELTIRRGLDQPFTSHPRLDLFVGSSSPHKKGEMGCTICHDGQGSATDFKWASHTPNTPQQAVNWTRDHGWFDNHHWIFPMTPERFIESNCLKCHHEVVELEPSERFPEPPAPKLVEGYQLVREFGCYGCHEINGFDGPNKRIGPDLRVEPNYYDVAAQVLNDKNLSDEQREWAMTLAHSPDADSVRHRLLTSIQQDSAAGSEARLTPVTHALADGLKDVDAPGSLRRVGPSLRHLDSKVDYGWLFSWIRKPADFRPSTRMPQFFGHFQHLDHENKDWTITDANGQEVKISDAEYTARFEDIEIRSLSDFLLANSQPYEYIDPPQGITEAPSAERGKWLFESRGCLACHSHAEFPGIASNQGPDLSRVAAKFNSGKGQRWLYSWLRQPNSYHARTVMPNLYLEPIVEKDANNQPTGRVSDPAADIATFLLSVPPEWMPTNVPASRELTADEERALEDLTAVWLSASFPKRRAQQYAREGIPNELAGTVKPDERGLLQLNMTAANRTQQQLEYVARRSLSRYGCFGCHDIPGYETAKPIGTPLANWGRKDTSQLAFENIATFLESHGIEEDGSGAHSGDEGGGHHGLDPLAFDEDTGYFLQSLNSHQRQGFLWQKLRMPRSFDFATTKTKRYDERLRMPRFPFSAEQREAVMTFILGLTSEPPAAKYIFNPSPRQRAIVQGRHVLDKYNCKGCHVLDMERWQIAFAPETFEAPPAVSDFPFLAPVVSDAEIKASLTPDRRGMLQADVHGLTVRNEETGEPSRVDIDAVPLEPDDTESDPYYEFGLYRHAVVEGAARLVGVQNLLIPANRVGYGPADGRSFPTNGGDLAKYLFSRVIAEEHRSNPATKGSEAWGWLPPPLHNEGEKVQTDWLHDFLMDPTAIRPAVVMRMPNFHMSSAEASALVNYFAAKSDAEFPYEYNVRRRGDYLAKLESAHPTLMDDAMKIVTDGNYCVKCHSVGDYQVVGAVKTLGPNLTEVYRRLRPDYVRRYVANPQRILPYTGMPVNIPYDANAPHQGGVSQELFPGTSTQQLDGLVDLLMNFDEYAKRRTSIRNLVKQPPAAPGSAAIPPPLDDQAARR
jgi:cytochrome c2